MYSKIKKYNQDVLQTGGMGRNMTDIELLV